MAPAPPNTTNPEQPAQGQGWDNKGAQNAPLNSNRVNVNQKIVDQVMAETKEGFNDKLNSVLPIGLTFENVSIWAKMEHRTGFCKKGKLLKIQELVF